MKHHYLPKYHSDVGRKGRGDVDLSLLLSLLFLFLDTLIYMVVYIVPADQRARRVARRVGRNYVARRRQAHVCVDLTLG